LKVKKKKKRSEETFRDRKREREMNEGLKHVIIFKNTQSALPTHIPAGSLGSRFIASKQ
jgi:hypothetical protein